MAHPGGRPTLYSEQMADTICRRLAEGESLRTICAEEGMPSRGAVFGWLNEYESFRTKYARAREFQAEGYADEMADIADDGSNDWMERVAADGESLGWQVNGEAVARSKIRLEQRRWYAEKLLPKKYGSKQSVEVTVSSADALREARDRMSPGSNTNSGEKG